MSSRWADLPRDLLLDILFRLHDAADYVRFHAVSKAWRDPILPPLCRPALLPWLRAPHAGYGIWKTRRIFSSKTSVHGKAHGIFSLMSSLHRKAGCIFSSKISIHDGALPGNRFQRGYNVESRGQSLYLLVRLQDETGDGIIYNDGILVDHVGAIGSPLASTVSVSVYALEGTEEDRPRWVPKDGRNFADQVMFLGQPSSFAVDAVRFGMTGRGCAYFVDARQVHRRIRGKLEPGVRCRVLKYGFHDGKLELVEELPEDWNSELCTWLTLQPSIAPAEVNSVPNPIKTLLNYLSYSDNGQLIW